MVEEWNGFDSPGEIETEVDAAEFMGLDSRELLEMDEEDSLDRISERFRELSTELHPDVGGTDELFRALQVARDELTIFVETPGDLDSEPGPEGEEGVDEPFTQESDLGREDRRDVVNAVRDFLEEQGITEEDLKREYGPNATMDRVVNVLSGLIITGAIDLGDVSRFVGEEGTYRRGGGGRRGPYGTGRSKRGSRYPYR